jgi:hypothetical protein
MTDFMESLTTRKAGVWRWDGTFRNYSWDGTLTKVFEIGEKCGRAIKSRKSKKDFVRIAGEIAKLKSRKARKRKADEIMPSLMASSPRFNARKFVAACNL